MRKALTGSALSKNDPFLQASIFQLLQDPGDERQLISMCLLTDDPSQVLWYNNPFWIIRSFLGRTGTRLTFGICKEFGKYQPLHFCLIILPGRDTRLSFSEEVLNEFDLLNAKPIARLPHESLNPCWWPNVLMYKTIPIYHVIRYFIM